MSGQDTTGDGNPSEEVRPGYVCVCSCVCSCVCACAATVPACWVRLEPAAILRAPDLVVVGAWHAAAAAAAAAIAQSWLLLSVDGFQKPQIPVLGHIQRCSATTVSVPRNKSDGNASFSVLHLEMIQIELRMPRITASTRSGLVSASHLLYVKAPGAEKIRDLTNAPVKQTLLLPPGPQIQKASHMAWHTGEARFLLCRCHGTHV